jgi:hypothetical protein
MVLILGHFLLGFQEDWAISCSRIRISFVIHAIQRSILALAPAAPSAHIATSGEAAIFSSIKGFVSVFELRRSKIFLQIFRWPASIRVDDVDLLVYVVEALCALSALIVLGGS